MGAGLHRRSRQCGPPSRIGKLPDLEAPDYFETEQPIAEMMTVGQLRRYVQELSASGLNVDDAGRGASAQARLSLRDAS